MTTVAAPHEGLGVDCYAWSSSPLRRYVRPGQPVAADRLAAGEKPPPFPPKSADLLAAMRDFELTYAAYAEFQRGMERYWCLRWLRQAGHPAMSARVLRESLVRLEAIPLIFKVPSMPTLPPGTRVQLAIDSTDLVDVEVRATYLETLAEASGEATEELDEADLPPRPSTPRARRTSPPTPPRRRRPDGPATHPSCRPRSSSPPPSQPLPPRPGWGVVSPGRPSPAPRHATPSNGGLACRWRCMPCCCPSTS
jgi:hypothetical protein